MPAHDIVLYAIWKDKEYTVTTVGVDKDGDGNDDTYTARYNQQLKELEIPNPTAAGKLFMGWKTVPEATGEESVSISGNYRIIRNLRIEPTWNELKTKQVEYKANVPAGLTGTGTAPDDPNSYTVGGKLVIKGTDLYVTRKDVKGNEYKAPFAFWNTAADGSGENYYPGATITVKESGPDTLTLYAVYSEYRETVLTYDGNATDAVFKQADENWTLKTDDYTADLKENGQVDVLYRDKRSTGFVPGHDMIPNQTFPIGQDQEGRHFTVARTDNLGNSYLFAGWSTDQAASVAMAKNGDKAYVNTITVKEMVNGTEKEVLHNTLYAVWGICKIVDKNGTEHVFDTLQKAVSFISTSDLITNKTATIEMLIDYIKPNSDAVTIPADCNITLTTAKTGTLRYNGTNTNSVITRSQNGASMLENNGTLTLTDITLDGASGTHTSSTVGGIINTNANSTLNVNSGTTIRNSKAENGGGIYVLNGATATVTEASFSNCEATVDGGAIYVYTSGSLTVNGATSFTNCKAKGGLNGSTSYGDGGAIFSEGTLNLLGTEGKHITFTHCTAMRDGGGVRLNDANYDVRIEYCDFETCSTTATDGGAMFLVGKSLAISNCDIQNCTAGWQGGGILIQTGNASTTNTTLTDITVKGCSAQNGGGIYVHTGNIALTGGTIEDCRATGTGDYGNGGAIFLSGGAKITENGLLIDGHSSLVLTDNDETNKTQASGATANAVRGGGIYVDSGAQFSFTGGELIKLKASGDGGAIYNKGTIVMTEDPVLVSSGNLKRGSLEYCSAQNGGAIYNAEGGTIDMTGGYIEHCMASENGGGIYTESTASVATGKGAISLHSDSAHPGKINNCSATGDGGGIYLAAGKLDMSGGEVVDCSAANGGGIFANDGTTLKLDELQNDTTLLRGTIESCTASTDGGGIYVDTGATLTMHGGGIESCSATDNGGGIYNNGTFTMTNTNLTLGTGTNVQAGIIRGCHAANGGGIYDAGGDLAITGGTIEDCYATTNGGAIYDASTGNLTIHNITINGHTSGGLAAGTKNAGQKGGAIYAEDGHVEVKDSYIYDCTATQGGAIYHIYDRTVHTGNASTFRDLKLINVTLDGHVNLNETVKNATNGGAVYIFNGNTTNTSAGPQLKIDGSRIKDCTAGNGGAIYCDSPAMNSLTTPTVWFTNESVIDGHDSLRASIWNADSTDANNGLNNGGGGVFMQRGTLLVENSSINDCTALANGGAIYNMPAGTPQDFTVKLSGATIDGHVSLAASQPNTGDYAADTSGYGGGVFMKMGKLVMENSTITDCMSPIGAAIYARTNDSGTTVADVKMVGGSITGNKATSENGGAINVKSDNTNVPKVHFEGNAVVESNTNTAHDTGHEHNMVLEADNNGVINTTSAGLGENAHIGVYCTTGNPYNYRGQYEQDFGTHGTSTANFNAFTNDRNGLYGEISSTANKIRWQSYLCKLTDASGVLLYTDNQGKNPAVYDYLMTQSTTPSGKLGFNGVLGGFSETTKEKLYYADGSEYAYSADKAINVEMLKSYTMPVTDAVNNSASRQVTFTTANANQADNQKGDIFTYWADKPDTMSSWPTDDLRRSRATLIMKFTGNDKRMVFTKNDFVVDGLIFDGGNNTGGSGAAIQSWSGNGDRKILTVKNASFRCFKSSGNGGAIYHKCGDLTLDNVVFGELGADGNVVEDKGCVASGDGGAVYHDNGTNDRGYTIQNTQFYGCVAGGNGGAFSIAPEKTTLGNVTIKDCKAGWNSANNTYNTTGDGGGMMIRYGHVTMTENQTLTIDGCSAAVNGGGICFSETGYDCDAKLTAGSAITNCKAVNGNGGGIGVVSRTGNSPNGVLKLTLDGAAIDGCEAGGNGGGIYAEKALTMQNVATISNCKAGWNGTTNAFKTTGDGGGVYLLWDRFNFSGSSITGCGAVNGGGVYLGYYNSTHKAEMTMTGGSITANTATESGAGIYVEEQAVLNLSGNPNFGGSNLKGGSGDDKDDILGTSGNFISGSLTNAKNGTRDYAKARQDIYTAETAEDPASIVVTGELTGDPGSIWVWAASENHYKQLMPFAVWKNGISLTDAQKESTMAAFRNAWDDVSTENGTDTYLFGTTGDKDTLIYWTGSSGSRKVILRKVSNTYESLSGGKFTIYKGTTALEGTDINGNKTTSFTSGESGVFYLDTMKYGTYFIEETQAPSGYKIGWFYLIVGDDVYMSEQYATKELAETAAATKNAEIRAAKAGTDTTP